MRRMRSGYKLHKAMNEIGIEKFKIELVELFPCTCRIELTAREGHFIRQFDTINKGYNQNVAGRTYKQYNDEHKEQHREYREQHKEEIKNYRDMHKEEKKRILQAIPRRAQRKNNRILQAIQ